MENRSGSSGWTVSIMDNPRCKQGLSLVVACLLTAASLVMAQASDKRAIQIGGAIGINDAYGGYGESKPHRPVETLGPVDPDIFRLNADLDYQNVIGRVEHRWYDGYGMFHAAWLGYDGGDSGTLKAGLVRVPFGLAAYDAGGGWYFDRHFHNMLSDDMDLGVTWGRTFDKLTLDVGYYPRSDFQTNRERPENSRYIYDRIRPDAEADTPGDIAWGAGENGLEEQHRLNLRAVYALRGGAEVGASLQYGLLQGANVGAEGGDHYTFSAHVKNAFSDFTLYSQLTYYTYNLADTTPWGTGLIPKGAYDAAWPVASEGIIPALSLTYNGINTSGISWLDSFTPYIEWSSVLKPTSGHDDHTLVTIGAAWTLNGNGRSKRGRLLRGTRPFLSR